MSVLGVEAQCDFRMHSPLRHRDKWRACSGCRVVWRWREREREQYHKIGLEMQGSYDSVRTVARHGIGTNDTNASVLEARITDIAETVVEDRAAKLDDGVNLRIRVDNATVDMMVMMMAAGASSSSISW